MKTCPVDVVIPVHDGRRWIARAITSVLDQDPSPARVLVVDDGSRDGTPEVVAGFGHRVTLVRHPERRGLPAARNTGIRAGSAELVAFLDADDAWRPGMIAAQLEAFARHPDIGLCWTRVVECDEDLRPVRERRFRRREAERCFDELYLEAFPIPPSATFVRRKALEDVGMFDERFLKAQDFELWLRIALVYPLSCIDRPLCLRRLHGESITGRSRVEDILRFDEMCFRSIADFAATRGRPLPMPVEERIVLSRRRRLEEMLAIPAPSAARACRADLRSRRSWRVRDELAFWPRLGLAAARRLLRGFDFPIPGP